ncbi:MAG: PP2C family serine/threonine-protein phosphatase, partial [Halocynthiibacter sp.]
DSVHVKSRSRIGADLGFAVLADGMGGHTSGDVASKIAVTEVFSELKLQSGDLETFEENITDILLGAALAANECVSGHVRAHPDCSGMGTTLVAPVFIRNFLYWISVGDSPLYLYRNGILKQLNEDHSMAPQIDCMVKSGQITEESGYNHPDRNCLTSVLIGRDIARIDCPKTPVKLRERDVVIVASDGLQFLSNAEIEKVLTAGKTKSSSEIVEILLARLDDLADPDQDNISFSVVRILKARRCADHWSAPLAPALENKSPQIPFRSRNGQATAAHHAARKSLAFLRGRLKSRDASS